MLIAEIFIRAVRVNTFTVMQFVNLVAFEDVLFAVRAGLSDRRRLVPVIGSLESVHRFIPLTLSLYEVIPVELRAFQKKPVLPI
ncbi:hypothetical protein [Paenibacillus sp. PDC88]|nr:hypothetical protein [Paenibacillus sp. PDC88]